MLLSSVPPSLLFSSQEWDGTGLDGTEQVNEYTVADLVFAFVLLVS